MSCIYIYMAGGGGGHYVTNSVSALLLVVPGVTGRLLPFEGVHCPLFHSGGTFRASSE